MVPFGETLNARATMASRKRKLSANHRNAKNWSVRPRSIGMVSPELTSERAARADGQLIYQRFGSVKVPLAGPGSAPARPLWA